MSKNGPDIPGLSWSAASERNREPIFAALRPRLPGQGRLLEIGAGTGQHAVWMARRYPNIEWLPTDLKEALPGLRARIEAQGPGNVLAPRALDVRRGNWPPGPFDAVYSANTAHIMHWDGVCAMFEGVARRLRAGGGFFLYGPFNVEGRFTAPSNEAFDRSLKARDPGMGIRDMDALDDLARGGGMALEERLQMPANNFLLVFRRDRPHEGHHEPI